MIISNDATRFSILLWEGTTAKPQRTNSKSLENLLPHLCIVCLLVAKYVVNFFSRTAVSAAPGAQLKQYQMSA
jgi:hypothetical protein